MLLIMKLGFHYHIPAFQNELGEYWTAGEQGVFLDSLASKCETLICFLHTPLENEIPYMSYRLQSRNISLVSLGPHEGLVKRLLRTRWILASISAWFAQIDVLLLRGPSPFLPSIAHRATKTPVVLLIVGDYRAGISSIIHTGWRRELIRLFVNWNAHQQSQIAGKALTLVNSQRLYDELSARVVTAANIKLVRTTTITESDFYYREDTCASPQIKLLYTGRIVRGKGLFELMDAVAELVAIGKDVILDLVGRSGFNDPIVDDLRNYAQKKGINDRVFYHGYKTLGPELFAYHRAADIFVSASSDNSEGFPRTIWEAFAHSLPVVTTKVGSVPWFLKDRATAMLVEPENITELSEAIAILIDDSFLRRLLIKNGRTMAQGNTLELSTSDMISSIDKWLKKS